MKVDSNLLEIGDTKKDKGRYRFSAKIIDRNENGLYALKIKKFFLFK